LTFDLDTGHVHTVNLYKGHIDKLMN